MCLEDIRLGRQLAPDARIVNVPQTSLVTILPPDPMRTRIMVSSDGITVIYLIPEGADATMGVGWCLTISNPTTTLRIEDWGRLICGGWRAFGGAVDVLALVVTSTLEKS